MRSFSSRPSAVTHFVWGTCFALVCFFLFAADSNAATYYSSPSGSGTICLAFSPCSYATGVGKLVSGDTLMLGAGTYNTGINGSLIPSGSSWTSTTKIKGAGMYNGTKIVPSGVHGIDFTNSNKQYMEFSDFEIDATNANNDGINFTDGATGNTHHIRFSRINVHNAPNQNIFASEMAANLEFLNLDIHHTAPNGCYVAGLCHGMYINASNVLIDGISLHNNEAYGIQFYPSPTSGIIRNSIVYGNGSTGIGLFGSNNQALNNTSYNNVGQGIWITSGNTAINNISYLNGESNIYGPGTSQNNFTSNPNFVNAGTGDFHLQSSSGVINTGTNLGSEVSTDKDGVTRPQGPAYDIGAYEYISGGSTQTLLGDINGDKIVNSLDWSLMSAKWLTSDISADLNKDGLVNSLDWSVMSSNWLKTQ